MPLFCRSRGARARLAVSLCALALALFLPAPGNSGRAVAGLDLVVSTYAELDRLRDEKLTQLQDYLDRVNRLAGQAGADPVLGEYFRIRSRFVDLQAKQAPPAEALAAITKLDLSLREHYLANYLAFYDILFVARDGSVFHTIRGEADAGTNLFGTEQGDSALGKRLRRNPDASFVDYEYYEASGEPSAFFVEPIRVGGKAAGWLVLQCTIDKLNRIFARGDYLGGTGEVFLVNRERQMLTDSRFRADTSVLRQHLSEENISAKFGEGRGHKIITDYRGQRALTSFEVFPVLDREWLLIAKIDEDEVVTRAWQRTGFDTTLAEAASAAQPPRLAEPRLSADLVRVDMDEFRGTRPGAGLLTYGVSTCTAVVIGRPGHFGYLGHASVYDRCYGGGDMDLVAQMLQRIRQFEVYPSELRDLRAVIVAPHANSARGIVERLLDAGLFLSQITFVADPAARRADVLHDPETGATRIHWFGAGDRQWWVDAADVPDLGRLAQAALAYPAAVTRADTRAQAVSDSADTIEPSPAAAAGTSP
jgi:hypothetical protein